jgi:uncharacterized OsmC-like protein
MTFCSNILRSYQTSARQISPKAFSRFYLSTTTATSSQDDNEYLKSYKLNGIGKGSRVEITTNTGHNLATDVPKYMGGTDTAPQPVETLLSAWMGCTQATAIFVGRQMKPRIAIDSIEFSNIQGFRDERGALQLPIDVTPEIPSRLQQIKGTILVTLKSTTKKNNNNNRNEVPSLTDEQLRLLKIQTEIRCPVANMLIQSGCSIDVKWELASP